MAKAILALRHYPVALLAALLLFACSLIIATQSVGVLRAIPGGDDQGSGMGGTGRSGQFGESGLGGTGSPSPFLGDADIDESETDSSETTSRSSINSQSEPQQSREAWPAPWMPRQDQLAVGAPDAMAPVIELQRTPLPQDPFSQPVVEQPAADALRIFDPDAADLPPHTRRMLDLAEQNVVEETTLEINLTVPEFPDVIDTEALAQENVLAPRPNASDTPEDADGSERPELYHVVDHLTDSSELPDEQETADGELDRRASPERIQRPELPPFQRIRPAVDRAAVTAPRPQPMRI